MFCFTILSFRSRFYYMLRIPNFPTSLFEDFETKLYSLSTKTSLSLHYLYLTSLYSSKPSGIARQPLNFCVWYSFFIRLLSILMSMVSIRACRLISSALGSWIMLFRILRFFKLPFCSWISSKFYRWTFWTLLTILKLIFNT